MFFFQCLFLFYTFFQFEINRSGPLLIMFIIHAGTLDLLLKELDLAFQLLLQECRLIQLTLCLLNRRIDLIYLILNELVFVLHILILLICLIKLILCNCKLLVHIFHLLFQTHRFHKKHIDVVPLQFFFLLQVNLRCLCLFLQRPELFLQLSENIIDTNQILLLFFQLFQRHIFPSFKLYDTSRFIKEFSSFFRFTVQNLINLSLPDDRISFFTDTRIVEHLINILKTAGASIDQILAFP